MTDDNRTPPSHTSRDPRNPRVVPLPIPTEYLTTHQERAGITPPPDEVLHGDDEVNPDWATHSTTDPDILLSAQQTAVLNWVLHGRGSAFVEAVAGSGKTFTLVEATAVMQGTIALAAFNKSIAVEIGTKVTNPRARVATYHSFGVAAWRNHVPAGVRVDDYGKRKRMMEECNVPTKLEAAVDRMVSIAKQTVVGRLWNDADAFRWTEIIDHFDIKLRIEEGGPLTDDQIYLRLMLFARECIKWSREVGDTLINFDDMLWLPLVEHATYDRSDWVLTDEGQDTNPARRLTAAEMLAPNGRMLWVGDRNQCQPEGTLVSVVRKKGNRWHRAVIEEVKIEHLKVGDLVVSYVPSDSAFVCGRRVNAIASRKYNGEVIEVSDGDGERYPTYTPNHKCLVNFSPLRDYWALYLVRRGNQYRIGKCKMDYSHASGVSARMHHEKADAAWILRVFETEQEAFYTEQANSGRFGLPQLMFNPDNHQHPQAKKYLSKAWKFIGENTDRGERCLSYYGRDPELPLFERGTGQQQTIKRPMVTAACNILDGCLMLPYRGGQDVHSKSRDWLQITVSRAPYSCTVYSLDVAGSGFYVSDGFVTHNSIYGFTGADNDAVDRIVADFDCVQLPLSTTYRCSKAATALAQTWVPHIEAHTSNRAGTVIEVSADTFMRGYCGSDGTAMGTVTGSRIHPGDGILCRNTRPLVTLAFRLLRTGIACHVEGRDIGKQLSNLASKWKVATCTALLTNLESYRARETTKLEARNAHYLVESLNDRIDTLIALMDGCETVAELTRKIDSMFKDTTDRPATKLGTMGYEHRPAPSPTVTLSTIHKAKGREWNRVFILGWHELMPSKWARQPWEITQEDNLMYVAVTRTKDALVLVELPSEED